MFDFHKKKQWYFDTQTKVTEEYIIPFIENHIDLKRPLHVLEIGCAEAGVLKAFTKRNHKCFGVELSEARTELAKKFMEKEFESGQVKFMSKNIYDVDIDNEFDEKFDLVILKDVIEHIHEQHIFIGKVHEFLKPGGMIFFAFPPWQMPFGGHQQLCKNKFLSRLPYYHLLPKPLYKMVLKLFGESEKTIDVLLEIKDTRISIEQFERICKNESFKINKQEHYLFNPIYQYKFGLTPRKQIGIVKRLPYIRNFLTTGVYYLIEKKKAV